MMSISNLSLRLDRLRLNQQNSNQVDESKTDERKEEEFSFLKDPMPIYSTGKSGGVWRVLGLRGNKVVAASYDGLPKLYKIKKISEKSIIQDAQNLGRCSGEVLSIAKVNDKVFVTSSADSFLFWWNAENGRCIWSLKDRYPTGFYSSVILPKDRVATGSCDRPKQHNGKWEYLIKVWDISKRRFMFSLRGHKGGISGLVSMNDDVIVSSSGDATVRVWSIKGRNQVTVFRNHSDYVYGLAKLTSDCVVTGGRGRKIRIFDLNSGKESGCLKETDGFSHVSTIYDVNTLNQNIVASASRDGYVKIWDCRKDKSIKILDPADGFVYAANFLPNGNVIAGTSGHKSKTLSNQSQNKKLQKKNNAHVIMWEFRSI